MTERKLEPVAHLQTWTDNNGRERVDSWVFDLIEDEVIE
jgi:hypothetical protein